MYSHTGDMGALKMDNSTQEMLKAEKMVLMMEMKLEEGKGGVVDGERCE